MLGCEEFRHVKHQYLSTYCDKKFKKNMIVNFQSVEKFFGSWGILNSKKFDDCLQVDLGGKSSLAINKKVKSCKVTSLSDNFS